MQSVQTHAIHAPLRLQDCAAVQKMDCCIKNFNMQHFVNRLTDTNSQSWKDSAAAAHRTASTPNWLRIAVQWHAVTGLARRYMYMPARILITAAELAHDAKPPCNE
jgi:hypothetical protein